MTSSREPVVCSLGANDASNQALEWADLQGLARHAAPLPNGARMTFSAERSAQVLDLAEREAACCRFLTITTSVGDDGVTVEITSDDPAAAAVITALSGV